MAQDKNQAPADEARTQDDEQDINIEAPQNEASEDANHQEQTVDASGSEQQAQPTQEELNAKAEQSKMSALEKERNQILKQQEAILSAMAPRFQRDPELYEEWRQRFVQSGGEDPGTHSQVYGETNQYQQPQQGGNYQQNNYNQQGGYNQQTYQQGQQSNLTPEQVRLQVQQEIESRDALREFVQEYPEMDPSQMTDEERQKTAQWWNNKLSPVAAGIKRANPEWSQSQVLKHAYRVLNIDNDVEKAKEIGEQVGRQNAYITGAGNSPQARGKANSSDGSLNVRMTAAQKSRYDQLLRTKGKKFANRYAKNVAALQSS